MQDASVAGRVHRKHKAGALGRIGHALRDHTGFGPDRWRTSWSDAGELAHLHLGHGFQLFGVDDHARPGQRYRAAGVAGAAPARDDGQAQFDAALDQPAISASVSG